MNVQVGLVSFFKRHRFWINFKASFIEIFFLILILKLIKINQSNQ